MYLEWVFQSLGVYHFIVFMFTFFYFILVWQSLGSRLCYLSSFSLCISVRIVHLIMFLLFCTTFYVHKNVNFNYPMLLRIIISKMIRFTRYSLLRKHMHADAVRWQSKYAGASNEIFSFRFLFDYIACSLTDRKKIKHTLTIESNRL